MNILLKKISTLALLLVTFRGVAITAPVFRNIIPHTQVVQNGNIFEYRYTIHNPPGTTLDILGLNIALDADPSVQPPSFLRSPIDWYNRISPDNRVVIWAAVRPNTKILPGTEQGGFGLDSYIPPTIGQMVIFPSISPYLRQIQAERQAAGLPFTGEEQMAIRGSVDSRSPILIPAKNQGGNFLYERFDRWMADTAQVQALGWITDAALLGNIQALQAQAREAATAQDGFTALARLTSILSLIQASTPSQRTDEGYALIYYNALFLSNASLYPCEPIFTLTPDRAEHHLGETHTATATLTNRVDGLRIENNDMTITVLAGPNAGRSATGVTDANGEFSFAYTSTLLGEDTLQAFPPGYLKGGANPAGSRPGGATPRSSVKFPLLARKQKGGTNATSSCFISSITSAKVKVLWKEGPDLVVKFFTPNYLESAPGNTFWINESTENRGKVAASATVTRYYLSTMEPVDVATARVIGQRIVPPLGQGVENEVENVPFTVPADLPEGIYHLTACADADGQVIETNEANNCAQSLLESHMGVIVKRDNHPPVANNQSVLVNQNASLAITLTATDEDHDPLTYAIVAPPVHGALSGSPPAVTYTPTAGYFGPDRFTFKANDGKADSNVATVTIRVNALPECAKAKPQPPYLSWPPNHKFVPVAITGVTDPDGDPVMLTVTAIRQDEPVKSPGSGNFSPDGILAPLQMRNEREGTGNGRIYHISFKAADNQGGSCTGKVTVCVPHDQGQPPNCVDGGPLYDSTLP